MKINIECNTYAICFSKSFRKKQGLSGIFLVFLLKCWSFRVPSFSYKKVRVYIDYLNKNRKTIPSVFRQINSMKLFVEYIQ